MIETDDEDATPHSHSQPPLAPPDHPRTPALQPKEAHSGHTTRDFPRQPMAEDQRRRV